MQTWSAFRNRRPDLVQIVGEIRSKAARTLPTDLGEPVEGEGTSEEGRLLVRLHHHRERDQRLVRLRKAAATSSPEGLVCEACGFDFEATYGSALSGFIECHHVLPLAASGPRRTRLEDLALLCANCHRAAHRIRPWPSIAELRGLVSGKEPTPS